MCNFPCGKDEQQEFRAQMYKDLANIFFENTITLWEFHSH